MSGASMWPNEDAELAALERLFDRINAIQNAGFAQEQSQQQALHALKNERQMIENALRQLDMSEGSSTNDEGLTIASVGPSIQYSLPLLHREEVNSIPLLRSHADERRRLRALISTPPWSSRDVDCLHTAVQNERTRQNILYGTPDSLDWNSIAIHVPYHTPADCRTRWNLFQRPGLNHARWSAAEKKDLLAYVDRTDTPSWEEAASILGTGRTGFQALEMYQRSAKRSIEWTPELDQALLKAARALGPDWKAVALQLGYPVGCAFLCHQRHNKLKSQALVMGRWSPEEDAALRSAVAQFGCDWKRVEICVHGRTGQQCRERWVGRLANIPEGETQAVRRAWTKEEDDRLRACVHSCNTWVEVAAYVGSRSDKMVRERWLLLKRRDDEARRKGGDSANPRTQQGDQSVPASKRGDSSNATPPNKT